MTLRISVFAKSLMLENRNSTNFYLFMILLLLGFTKINISDHNLGKH